MDVVVPKLLDTGVIDGNHDGFTKVLLDLLKKHENFSGDEIVNIRRKKWSDRVQNENTILIARAWVVRNVRKIRVQHHPIRSDGTIGNRTIVFERHNGEVVRC